jgi:hypothetical protein
MFHTQIVDVFMPNFEVKFRMPKLNISPTIGNRKNKTKYVFYVAITLVSILLPVSEKQKFHTFRRSITRHFQDATLPATSVAPSPEEVVFS